jgi:type VI secretion system protein ImpL
MIKKLLSLLFNRWVLTAVGVLALSLVIWIVGPLIAIGEKRPLESESSRWITIGVVAVLAVLRLAWGVWRAKRTNQTVVNQLIAAPASATAEAETPEMKLLRERFSQALGTLRNARFASNKGVVDSITARWDKKYLYELPWYIIIGAPGSGKTTALLNSGLRFPLAGGADKDVRGVAGVGGTRNCDWWFTDEAVLIDTAGRYTTQDSDSDADRSAWNSFLGLLKKSRPRQPVNGVLVTVSVPDLLTRNAAERQAQAAAVRKRVQELHQQLGVRFPIYLMVTKCDLLSGFMDYLGDIDKQQRASPWGFTFKLDTQLHGDAAAFGTQFDALEARLTDGLIDRLQREPDVARRARIFGFPHQFAGVRNVLKDFVESVFAPSQFEAHPMLRGVYFVSGTQEGTPIDRLLGTLSRTYGIERAVLPPNQSSGKSFFLERLLREVVFVERELGGTDLKWERRRGALAWGGYAAIGLVALTLLTLWGRSYLGNRSYLNEVQARVGEVRQLVQATPNRVSPDLLPLLPALQATRDLASSGRGSNVPWSLGFGLYQGHKLESASHRAYERMLVDAVLPRIALGVEERLKTDVNDPELQYEALKSYVMLHDPQRFDDKALRLYVAADWEAKLPRSVTIEEREQLATHLDALLAQGPAVSPLPQDQALLNQVRNVLAATPLPQRIYSRLKRVGVGEDIPAFTIAREGGPGAGLVFTRKSAQPLTQGVPGLYTYTGYHRGFQREVGNVANQLADEESWVLGVANSTRAQTLRDSLGNSRLLDDVRRLYLTDYTKTWEAFIDDIKILPTNDMSKTVQMAKLLSAPDNPLRPLMVGLVRETTLSASEQKSVVEQAENKARGALERSRAELGRILAGKPNPNAAVEVQSIEKIMVDDRFASLRAMVRSPDGKGPAPIDGTISLIGEVYNLLITNDTAVRAGNVPPPSNVPDKAKSEAGRLPEPLRTLLQTLSTAGVAVTLRETRSNLGELLNAEVGQFCREGIAGRYPLARNSTRDATQEDFARLFAPGGLMDSFFQKHLTTLVDTSTRTWSFKELGGATMGDPGALLQFQRAAEIRDTFFRGGARAPSLQLTFKPVEMDDTISHFTLDVDGQLVKWSHGPQLPSTVSWPGPRGSSQVRLSLLPATGVSGVTKDGPWALFRLFDQANIKSLGTPERFTVTFDVEGRKATFEVSTSSVQNPFRLPELSSFTCPGRL